MKLIVGLGNPGGKYQDTRHNVGFMVIDHLAKELHGIAMEWELDTKKKVLLSKTGDVLLIKPQTYMNLSGSAVKAVMDFYKIDPSDVWVIHDDLDLPIGKIRVRLGGASAGHNGVDSIIKAVGTDKFLRFRLGIGRDSEARYKDVDRKSRRQAVVDFVLSKFQRSEAGSMKHLIKHGTEAVQTALLDGVDKAMNMFN